MIKTDIVKELAANGTDLCSLNQKEAASIVNRVLEIIMDGLKKDGNVQLTGFGTFKTREVAAREGHDPRNPSKKIMISARVQPSFSAGEQLKKYLNNEK